MEKSIPPVREPLSNKNVSRSPRLRKWFLGAILAAVTAAVVQIITGGVTSLGSSIWALLTGQEPLVVTVGSDFISFRHKGIYPPSYVIPRPVDQIPPPPDEFEESTEWRQWLDSLDAIDADETVIQITVMGSSATPVILTNLRVRVIERRPPFTGTHYTHPGGGPLGERYLEVNLDATPPVIIASEVEFGDRPVNFPYKVSATEPEVFLIYAHTERCDCTWVVELYWTAGDERGSTIINDNGKPFRTTSTQNATLLPLGEANQQRITEAAKAIGSKGGTELLRRLEREVFFVVVASGRSLDEAVAKARSLGTKGYPAEVYWSTTGFYGVTIGSFPLEQAEEKLNEAIAARDAPTDAYLTTGKRFEHKVFP